MKKFRIIKIKKYLFITLLTLGTFFCLNSIIAEESLQLTVGNLPNNAKAPLYCISKKMGGKDASPEVRWKNPPKDTKSFVLTCIDKNPIANNWVHWMILNIPSTIRTIPKGVRYEYLTRNYCIVIKNSFNKIGYGGPQPPPNTGIHNYAFTIYALDSRLKNIKPYSKLSEEFLLEKIKGHILDKAQFTLNYEYR